MQRFKTFNFLLHFLGCVLFLAFPLIFTNAGFSSFNLTLLQSFPYWFFCISFILLFYLNYALLAPKLLFRRQYIWYVIAVLAVGYVFHLLRPYDGLLHYHRDELMPPPVREFHLKLYPGLPRVDGERGRPVDIVSFLLVIITIGLSGLMSYLERWRINERGLILSQSEKTKAELSFLKTQINPHFLFNTLNNIYTLSVIHHPDTSSSILKLANIMRYATEESSQGFVPLTSEINSIKDYIELQKLRLNDQDEVRFELEGEVLHQRIAPLILLAFVENAFKHGLTKREKNIFHIKITVEHEKISFFCQNGIQYTGTSKPAGTDSKKMLKRLAQLYDKRFNLHIDNRNQLYTVNLQLNC